MGVDGACVGEMRVWRESGGGKGIGAWEKGAKIAGVEVGHEGCGSGEEARDSVWGADSEDGRGEEEGDGWVGVNGMRSVEWGALSTDFQIENEIVCCLLLLLRSMAMMIYQILLSRLDAFALHHSHSLQ